MQMASAHNSLLTYLTFVHKQNSGSETSQTLSKKLQSLLPFFISCHIELLHLLINYYEYVLTQLLVARAQMVQAVTFS